MTMRSAPSVDPVLPSEHSAGHCIGCGYPLLGLVEPRCPECGLAFDPNHAPPADIPWLARRKIGNFRAYVRTVFRVVAFPERFARPVRRRGAVSRRETDMFRRVTIAVATGSVVATAPLLPEWNPSGLFQFLAALVGIVLLPVPVALFFWMATWRVELWSIDTGFGDEVRFYRMQMFACAGLGLAPIVPLVTWGWAAMVVTELLPLSTDPRLIAVFASACVLAAWLGGDFTFHLLGGRLRAWQAAWFIVARLALIAAAAVAGFFSLMLLAMLVTIVFGL